MKNTLKGKKIKIEFGMPGNKDIITATGIFKELLTLSETDTFAILSNDNQDILVNVAYSLKWIIENPPKEYVVDEELQENYVQ